MRKVWDQLKLKPWDYEIASLAEVSGNEHEAKNKVVMKWMQAGDFRPLRWMIKKEGVLRGPVLHLLARMLATDQLTLKGGRGRPQDLEAAARDEFAADTYEDSRTHLRLEDGKEVGSDDLFRAVGSVVGTGQESVRQAVTARRKRKR
jgi:hypothetical protein